MTDDDDDDPLGSVGRSWKNTVLGCAAAIRQKCIQPLYCNSLKRIRAFTSSTSGQLSSFFHSMILKIGKYSGAFANI